MAKKTKTKIETEQEAEGAGEELNEAAPKPVKQKKISHKIENPPPRILTRMVGTLGSALDQDSQEIDEIIGGEGGEKEAAEPHTRLSFFALGVVVLILSVIGLVNTVGFIVGAVGDIANQTALKDELGAFIFPVVVNDPPEFSDIGNLPQSVIISCSIWKIIMFDNTDIYAKEFGTMAIPAIDVETAAINLFGEPPKLSHQTVYSADVIFEYNAETNSYITPDKLRYYTIYSPKITALSKNGSTYVATVDYVEPTQVSVEAAGVNVADESAKTRIYTIIRTKDKMYIEAIEMTETGPQTPVDMLQ